MINLVHHNSCHISSPRHFCRASFSDLVPKQTGLALVVVLAITCLIAGCNSSTPEPATPKTPTPAAKFQWIVKRLRHALETFSPSGSLGLRAKRELTFDLFPPDSLESNYTARITITSKTFYKPAYRPFEKPSEKDTPEIDPLIYDNVLEEDALTDPLNNSLSELPRKELITQHAPTPMPSVDDQEIFELAYIDQQWQLITQPETQRAKNWFDYALNKMSYKMP